jgi:hypothetical protein
MHFRAKTRKNTVALSAKKGVATKAKQQRRMVMVEASALVELPGDYAQ